MKDKDKIIKDQERKEKKSVAETSMEDKAKRMNTLALITIIGVWNKK